MINTDKKFLRRFGGVDLLEDFPKRVDDEVNPYTGIAENEKRIKVEFGLPKFRESELEVIVDQQVVRILGSRMQNIGNHVQKKLVFKRAFRIPESVKPQAIHTQHHDDILSVILPKRKEQTSKVITIN